MRADPRTRDQEVRIILESKRAAAILVAAWVVLAAGCGKSKSSVGQAAASEATTPILRPGQPLDSSTVSRLAIVRDAAEKWDTPQEAMADGYVLFEAEPDGSLVGYIQKAVIGADHTSKLDDKVDLEHPEILLYARPGDWSATWKLAAVEWALPVHEEGSTRPEAARKLFPELSVGEWRVHPTREELNLNVKWHGFGDCHYAGGAVITLASGPGFTYVQLPPGSLSGEGWDGPDVKPSACAPTFDGQNLLFVHGKWWMLRAWVGLENPRGTFRVMNPRAKAPAKGGESGK